MKILSVVPVFADGGWTKRCLDRIQTDLLVIDNGAHTDVIPVIKGYNVLVNPKNIYVNPAWNQAMLYFLNCGDWTHLCIINSDLVLMQNWHELIELIWQPNLIPCVNEGQSDSQELMAGHEVESVPGIFLFLSREQVSKVFPIPYGLKFWFGENWIYNRLGLVKFQYDNLKAVHGNSRSCSVLPEFVDMVEKDKQVWDAIN